MLEWLKFWKRKQNNQRSDFDDHPEYEPHYRRSSSARQKQRRRVQTLDSDSHGIYGAGIYGGLGGSSYGSGGSIGGGSDGGGSVGSGSVGGGCDGGSPGM